MVDLRKTPQEEVEIWRAAEKPDNYEWQYNFSKFTLQLSLVSDQLKEKLPPTDTRFRPDQRALEVGDIELASSEKHRLEEAQRARRKEHQKNGTEHTPAYFVEKKVEETGESLWQSTGKYWEDRALKDW